MMGVLKDLIVKEGKFWQVLETYLVVKRMSLFDFFLFHKKCLSTNGLFKIIGLVEGIGLVFFGHFPPNPTNSWALHPIKEDFIIRAPLIAIVIQLSCRVMLLEWGIS